MNILYYLEKRKNKIVSFMKDSNLNVIILSNPENIFYYGNFNPILYSSPPFVIIKDTGKIFLLIHSLRNQHAQNSKNIFGEILLYGKWGQNKSIAFTYEKAIKKIIGENKINLGIEKKYISLELFESLKEKLNINIVKDIGVFITNQRMIKDEYEIECIKKACNLSDLGVKEIVENLKKGYSEKRACTEAHYKMRRAWEKDFSEYEICGFGSKDNGEVDSLNIWCMSNERISYGCDCPIDYMIKKGDLVLPMAWARVGGYCAETERTFFVEELSEEKDKIYETVLEARFKVFEILKPGIKFSKIYDEVEKIFIRNGYKNYLPGRIGHGIGLSAHDFPSISKENENILRENMVLTIEPGIMIENIGGVRHSDTILITKDGFELLTKLERGKLKIKLL